MGTKRSTTGGQHSFAQIPRADIPRSSLDRSCGIKTTFDSGFLVPIFCDEALPGDTLALKLSTFARLATPLHPVMDNMYMDTHFFSVPIRLIWDNWQRFNGEQDNPDDSTDFLVPVTTSQAAGYQEQSLSDYLGIPTKVPSITTSCLWHRAYNLIWNEWFRDENLQDSVSTNTDDGPDGQGNFQLLRRGKRHDYFSSSLPFPQKGPSVQLPLGDTAPLTLDTQFLSVDSAGDGEPFFMVDGSGSHDLIGDDGTQNVSLGTSPSSTGPLSWEQTKLGVQLEGATGITDLSEATSATINEIRQAFQIQKLFERDARGGSRYTEILRAHFGVVSPDQRLQRPEYLGGGSTPVNITTVAQTSGGIDVADETPQGHLAGYGIASSTKHGFTKSFVEHCILIGFVSVRADLNYQQGLPRMFSRRTRFDFFWPAFSHLGEQAVLNKEIFAQGADDPDADDEVFGYQERHAEYRYKPSMITGQMRSNSDTPLDTWHLAQDFEELPVLGPDFIEENPPIARIIAVPSEPEFIFDGYFSYRCARPMPTYGVPGLIDHF